MANSKYEYTRNFERPDPILPNTWIVIRIDGRGFHKISTLYGFVKPNDTRALHLMNAAAQAVIRELPDCILAYGQSDEFSFLLHKSCQLFDRRESKLVSTIVSTFTAHYIFHWRDFFPGTPLSGKLPTFDGRAVVYPSIGNLRDYMSWRQADCHINNLYNTTFWALVQKGGRSPTEAEADLAGTFSADKNEILFSRFGINYNNEPEVFKKGSILYRDYGIVDNSKDTIPAELQPNYDESDISSMGTEEPLSKTQAEKERKRRLKADVVIAHVDLIKDEFWTSRPWILEGRPPR